jgi:restriction system protein
LREDAISRDHLTRLTWIVTVASGFFVLWVLWRYGIAAEAAEMWPAWLLEIMGLFTGAGSLTLALLWGLIAWQRRTLAARSSGPRMTVDDLYALSPRAFEHFVGELFERRGYTVEVRGRAGDLGVDLAIRRPDGRLAIVQCKRYRHQVGPDIVRELFGTMVHERAFHGFLVTTAEISDAARHWAADKPITLIDGAALSALSDDLRA